MKLLLWVLLVFLGLVLQEKAGVQFCSLRLELCGSVVCLWLSFRFTSSWGIRLSSDKSDLLKRMTVSSPFVLSFCFAQMEFSVKYITSVSVYVLEYNKMGRLFPFFYFGPPFSFPSFLMRNEWFSPIHRHGSRFFLPLFVLNFVRGTTRCPSLAFLLGFRTGPVKNKAAVFCISGRLNCRAKTFC